MDWVVMAVGGGMGAWLGVCNGIMQGSERGSMV
jgi:hypothetical protein